jgi:hypothetical protein
VLIAPRYDWTGPRVYASSRAAGVHPHSCIGRSNESAGIGADSAILLRILALLPQLFFPLLLLFLGLLALLLLELLLLLLGLLLIFLGFAPLIVDDFLAVGIVVFGRGRWL